MAKDEKLFLIDPPIREDFESCDDCIHSGDGLEFCCLRLCVHAIAELKECYEPKSGKESE